MKLAVDISPLRNSREFRLLWTTLIVSETGTQITTVAVFFQVYQLTKSAAAVGLVGLFKLIAMAITTIAGGSIIDNVDRRKLLIVTQTGLFTISLVLMGGAMMDRTPLVLIYIATAIQTVFQALDSPSRSAITVRLVGESQLPAALALKQVAWNATQMVGPAIGGVIIAQLGLAPAYGIDAVSYVAGMVMTAMLPSLPPIREGSEVGATGIAAIKEGFSFLRRQKAVLGTFYIDLAAMVFGMPRALFPVLAFEQFHRGAEVTGLLFAAPAAGALIAATFSGWVGKVRRQGAAVIASVTVWGLGITAFGLAGDRLYLAMVMLAIAGAADVISAVFRSTIMQVATPDHLRGRLSAVFILVVAGGPRLGDLEAGLVAEAFSPRFSVVSGGIACLVCVALIAFTMPALRRYRSEVHADPTDAESRSTDEPGQESVHP